MTRLLVAAAVLAVALGASLARAGEIADLHAELAAPVAEEAPEPPVEGETPGVQRVAPPAPPEPTVTQVGLERQPGIAGGPTYWVIIGSGGAFRYVGETNVERLGEHTGTVEGARVQRLFRYVEDIGFRELDDTYTSRFLDLPSTYVMASWPDETKVILNYADSGPARLWAMAALIDALLADAEWDEPE